MVIAIFPFCSEYYDTLDGCALVVTVKSPPTGSKESMCVGYTCRSCAIFVDEFGMTTPTYIP